MKTAVLGYGNVGKELVSMINAAYGMELAYVLRRPGKEEADYMVSDIDTILNDSSVETVADVLPGIHPSYEYMKKALSAGKNVVTANKAALCFGYAELMEIADKNHVFLKYEASCGGTIPCINEIVSLGTVDDISAVYGIMNGTTNYILYNMDVNGADYTEVLKEAQRLGFAEADPTADVGGFDVKNKIAILSNTAYKTVVTNDFPVCGIDKITKEILDGFKSDKKSVKLLGLSVKEDDKYAIGVVPVVMENDRLEAHVPKNYNMITVKGNNCGEVKLYGQGAGGVPTADAVMRDLVFVKDNSYGEKVSETKLLKYDPSILTGTGYISGREIKGNLSELFELAQKEDAFLGFTPDFF